MVIYYKKLKKYNEIQLTKKQNYLNNRNMKNHPDKTMIKIEKRKKEKICFINIKKI